MKEIHIVYSAAFVKLLLHISKTILCKLERKENFSLAFHNKIEYSCDKSI